MNQEVLMDIGLSMYESKVFLALVELGESSVGDISKKCKVHRTNVYDSLKKLETKELVVCNEKEGTKYFNAKDPRELMKILKKKEDKLKQILPQFMLDYDLAGKTEAHIFEGVQAMHDLFDGLLKYKETVLTYGLPKEVASILGEWNNQHHKKRIAQKINMLHIYNDDAQERIKYLNNMEYTEARCLPKEYNSPVSTDICGEEVLFVFWKLSSPIIIQIKNKQIADYYKRYFEILWKMAKKCQTNKKS
jgi:sugar-specific transcriptional regulator TrmB